MMGRPLSFLDLTPIERGSTSGESLRQATALAQLADRLGYHRLWYAEHHNTTGLASSAPEILIAHMGAYTENIRLGSGGVMLPNHAPLRVIEAFRLLEALHPGRIDLGLGRAPGTDGLTAFAMRRSREAMTGDDYPQQLAELLAFDEDGFPADHPFAKIKAVPADVKMPPLWLLGSSDFSAQLAASAGFGFAFAAHINKGGAVSALRQYREQFVPSDRNPGAARDADRLGDGRGDGGARAGTVADQRSLPAATAYRAVGPIPHGRRGARLPVVCERARVPGDDAAELYRGGCRRGTPPGGGVRRRGGRGRDHGDDDAAEPTSIASAR